MEWFNASVTFLKSAEMLRSTMEQRGAWLTLMTYCIQQENGGRLGNISDWNEWDWNTVLGVPKKLTKADCLLWQWEDGGTLVLHGYPVEKEAEIRAKREAGKRGGLSSGQARARLASSTASTLASSSPSSSPSSSAATERKGKGKERKEKEEEGNPEGGGVLLSQWLDEAKGTHPDWPELDATAAWAHYDGIGWVNTHGHPVRSWQSCLITCYVRWAKAAKKNSVGPGRAGDGGAAREFDPQKPNAHTGGLPVFDGVEAAS